MPFATLTVEAAGALTIDGVALSQLSGDQLLAHAKFVSLPRSLSDEQQIRIVLGALLQSASSDNGVTASKLPKGTFGDMREEAAGLLILAAQRDVAISQATATALNVLNQPQVVEKYTLKGNRWTIAEACRDPAVEQARKELGGAAVGSTGEWLRGLGDALDAPVDHRPWYTSKMVLFVLFLAFVFVAVHALLLARVLMKVRPAPSSTAAPMRNGHTLSVCTTHMLCMASVIGRCIMPTAECSSTRSRACRPPPSLALLPLACTR